jgi:DNA-binding MarR family transcriptional regulator
VAAGAVVGCACQACRGRPPHACSGRQAKLCRGGSGEEGGLIQPTREDFENNLRFRVTLRRFLRWSEDQASAAGLTPAQHQLLVAIKGHPGPQPPAIRDLAEYLLLQSHSTVGLVDRAEAAGMVRRRQDGRDARVVRVYLTKKGDKLVTDLTKAHLAELFNLAQALEQLLPAALAEQQEAAE